MPKLYLVLRGDRLRDYFFDDDLKQPDFRSINFRLETMREFTFTAAEYNKLDEEIKDQAFATLEGGRSITTFFPEECDFVQSGLYAALFHKTGASIGPPPPQGANRLLYYLLPRCQRAQILGCLEEDYWTELLPRFGPREARRMYWSHAIRSVAPAVFRSSLWAALLGWLWRKLGS